MTTLTEHCDTEPIPTDSIGRAIYALKILGPTTVISAVLIWQGIKMTNSMQQERRETTIQGLSQTENVVKGLALSTQAIEEFADLSTEYIGAIEENTRRLEVNSEQIQAQTQILTANAKKLQEALDAKGQ
jgi:hypothetical protein